MLSVCLCFVVVVYSVRLCSSEEDLIVQTTCGRLRGVVTERVPGKRIHTFLGVPYAMPPVNDLRFEVMQLTIIIKHTGFPPTIRIKFKADVFFIIGL